MEVPDLILFLVTCRHPIISLQSTMKKALYVHLPVLHLQGAGAWRPWYKIVTVRSHSLGFGLKVLVTKSGERI